MTKPPERDPNEQKEFCATCGDERKVMRGESVIHGQDTRLFTFPCERCNPAPSDTKEGEMKIRPEVWAMASEMERNLRACDEIRGDSWKEGEPYDGNMPNEVDELEDAQYVRRRPKLENPSEAKALVTHEAADVANYAMFAAWVDGDLAEKVDALSVALPRNDGAPDEAWVDAVIMEAVMQGRIQERMEDRGNELPKPGELLDQQIKAARKAGDLAAPPGDNVGLLDEVLKKLGGIWGGLRPVTVYQARQGLQEVISLIERARAPLPEGFVSQRNDSDCYNACLASLTGIPIAEFPVWSMEDEDSVRQWNECNQILFRYDWMAEQVWPPRVPAGYCLASGPSPRGDWHHCVIVRDGKLVFDPHPSNDGLKGLPTLFVLPIRLARAPEEPERWTKEEVDRAEAEAEELRKLVPICTKTSAGKRCGLEDGHDGDCI